MKTFKYILLLLLVLVIGFSIYVAVQPNDYSFSRSRMIKAPKSLLFNKVNDFKNWPSFSPWIEQDTEATLTYGKKTSGEGAWYSWEGEVLGEGTMRTLEVKNNTSIAQIIEFTAPYEATSNINWDFERSEEGTKVTWSMNGKQDFLTKLFTVVMGSIESETGPNFERGLFKLDSLVNAEMRVYSIDVNGVTQHSGGFYLFNTTSCKFSEFQNKMKDMLAKVGSYALTHNISRSGAPFVLYHKWDEGNNAVIFSSCYPTNSKIITDDPDILTGQLNAFKGVKTTLKGNYDNLKEAWEKTMAYIETNSLKIDPKGPMLETYVTDPILKPNPADWVTEIFVAVK
ncbi:SRPBCC family protein [Winogradskyella aurantia]|uniref:Transcription activator effector-binding protein n=1 Tax=Winogradskyella aurantia TaxID=1915063 RepID=A0A265URM9_9FLAO|nr:SRPBCC family protein [Winogradskyella aurantia]OZV67969.1 transcription activator effector-binding protein [Winogradskyella aurantia]